MTKSVREIINFSGYPLQLFLKEKVEETEQQHKWRVIASEHRWINFDDKKEGFIDLILGNMVHPIRLVIECKRVHGSWNFLVTPNENNPKVLAGKYLLTTSENYCYWEEGSVWPESYKSLFCVSEVSGQKDQRTLENISGELLMSTEALAGEEITLWKKSNESENYSKVHKVVHIPVIVTTAELRVVEFNPLVDFDVENGEVSNLSSYQLDWIKFSKNLATCISNKKNRSWQLKDANSGNNRMVFVVQAAKFIDFLTHVAVAQDVFWY